TPCGESVALGVLGRLPGPAGRRALADSAGRRALAGLPARRGLPDPSWRFAALARRDAPVPGRAAAGAVAMAGERAGTGGARRGGGRLVRRAGRPGRVGR